MRKLILVIFILGLNQCISQVIVKNDTAVKKSVIIDFDGRPYYEKEYANDSLISVNYIDLNGEKRKVYTYVDEMPTIENETTPIYKYVNNLAQWPVNSDGQGVVIISIIVESNGDFSNIRVIKGIDNEINKEAIKAVKKLPRLLPGKIKGQAVVTEVTIPLYFKW